MPWHRRFPLHVLSLSILFTMLAAVAGCHSAYIDSVISNQTSAPLALVQVEYPSASFGAQLIAPGQDFKYRFKILGTGQMKLTYNDSTGKEHKSAGPTLSEGSEGLLRVVVTESGVEWQPALTAK